MTVYSPLALRVSASWRFRERWGIFQPRQHQAFQPGPVRRFSVRLERTMKLFMTLLLTAFCVSAQNANVSGLVKDPANSAVPNATVTVLNKDTGSKRTAVTNGEGIYSVAG